MQNNSFCWHVTSFNVYETLVTFIETGLTCKSILDIVWSNEMSNQWRREGASEFDMVQISRYLLFTNEDAN